MEGIELHISRRFTEGADYLRILFGAVFFVSLGVLADLRAFTLDQLLFMLVLTVAAVFSKLIDGYRNTLYEANGTPLYL